MRFLRAFLHDSVSWSLLLAFVMISCAGLSALFYRQDRVEQVLHQAYLLEFDIQLLKREKAKQEAWRDRMISDPMAWEQTAREKMNYLRPEEVLVTFAPANASN